MATEASRYGQLADRGKAATMTSGTEVAVPPTPISAKASVWSLMPCAMAFQAAWVTAAASTARVTVSERVVDGSKGAPQAGRTGALRASIPSGVPRVRTSRVAAPLGPVPAALIVSPQERAASGTLGATTC